MILIRCIQCGTKVKALRHTKQFCSDACKVRHRVSRIQVTAPQSKFCDKALKEAMG